MRFIPELNKLEPWEEAGYLASAPPAGRLKLEPWEEAGYLGLAPPAGRLSVLWGPSPLLL